MGKLPIGFANFEEIVSQGYDYVDKTSMIADILDTGFAVYLFTRPRRFGKTLNLSMLNYYFNVKYSGNRLFDGLKIDDLRKNDPEKNAYPVINISFNDIRVDGKKKFLSDVKDMLENEFRLHAYLEESEKLDKASIAKFRKIVSGDASGDKMHKWLKCLSEMLEMHHGKKVMIFLDEYDKCINDCKNSKMRDYILKFLKSFFTPTFKDNDSLRLGVITGIMQVAKEGLFSGMNNVWVNNVFDDRFNESYGFTEQEVRNLLKIHDRSDEFDQVRRYYDGYCFGNSDVYNPWSVMTYLSHQTEPEGYWASNSGSEIIMPLLEQDGIFYELSTLMGGGSLEKRIDPRITFAELHRSRDSIYSIMAMCGYLRTEPLGKGIYRISIPNMEISELMQKFVPDEIEPDFYRFSDNLMDSLQTDNPEKLESTLRDIFLKFSSFRILKNESDYHNLLYGILICSIHGYRISLEQEAGTGYYGICMRSRSLDTSNVVMELKRLRPNATEKSASDKADEALDQIKKKHYSTGLDGKTVAYGIVFRGKLPTVHMECLRCSRQPYKTQSASGTQ